MRLIFFLPMMMALPGFGCAASGDPLSADAVGSIPSGNASGHEASGELILERQVASCFGNCTVSTGGRMIVFCVVGQFTHDAVSAEQNDGSLRLHFERGPASDGSFVGWDITDELPITVAGGINNDAHFDVGGQLDSFRGSQQPNWPDVEARLQGAFSGQGMTADLRTRRTMSTLADDGTLLRITCESDESVTASRVQ